MSPSKQDTIWERIRIALENPQWDFRTLEGLAGETGYPQDAIKSTLDSHSEEIRKANVTDSQGRILYTLANRHMGFRELIANTRAFITKTPST